MQSIFPACLLAAGSLGMNTNDVRNMTLDQAAYCAVALLVTVGSVVVSL